VICNFKTALGSFFIGKIANFQIEIKDLQFPRQLLVFYSGMIERGTIFETQIGWNGDKETLR